MRRWTGWWGAKRHVLDGPLGDPVAPSSSQPRRANGVVDDEILKRRGETAVAAGEGHVGYRRAVDAAGDPWGVTDQLAGGEPDVELTPAPGVTSLVERRGDRTAASTPSPPSCPPSNRDYELRPFIGLAGNELPAGEHNRMAQPQQRD